MLEQLQVAKGKEYHLRHPTRFQIVFKLEGINKNSLQQVAKLIIQKSELLKYHQISYWKLCDDNQIGGIILLKKRWYKSTYPTIAFHYNKQTIHCDVVSYTIHEQKRFDKLNEIEADYIFNSMNEMNQIDKNIDSFEINEQVKKEDFIDMKCEESIDFKHEESQYRQTEASEDSSQRKSYLKEKKENEKQRSIISKDYNVHPLTENFNQKFILTQKIFNKLWSVFQKKNQVCYRVLWNRNISPEFRLQINQCFLGQPLDTQLLQQYLDILKYKYLGNINTHLISLILKEDLESNAFVEELEHFKDSIKESRGNYLFIYFDEKNNHTSLIIYNMKNNQVFNVDSKAEKEHILSIKLRLQTFLLKLFGKNQDKKMTYLIDPDDFWDSIGVIPCPSQRNQNDSHFICLRNIHEFLMQDKIDINLRNSYQIEEILHYRFYVAACLIYDKYLSSY